MRSYSKRELHIRARAVTFDWCINVRIDAELNAVEKHNTCKQHSDRIAGAVGKIAGIEDPVAEDTITKGLDNWRHGIGDNEPAEAAAAYDRERINNRRRKHLVSKIHFAVTVTAGTWLAKSIS